MELIDKVLSSFPFRNKAFIAWVYAIKYVERRHASVDPLQTTSIDHVSADVGVESSRNKYVEEEFMEGSKEGVLPLVKNHKAT